MKLATLLKTVIPAVALSATLAACSGSDDNSSSGASASAEPKAKIVEGPVPEVTGDFGAKPTVATPTEQPSKDLAVKVLKEGTGKEVKDDDLLIAHYLGQIWDTGAVFDNSYDRGEPAAFAIGAGKVIKGWDDALVGAKGWLTRRTRGATQPRVRRGRQ